MKFTRPMLFGILSVIILFFGGFLLMLNLLIDSESIRFINIFFGFFIFIAVVMVTFGYIMTNQIQEKQQNQVEPFVNAKNTKPIQAVPTSKGKVAAILCGSCGAQVTEKDKFCLECGSAI